MKPRKDNLTLIQIELIEQQLLSLISISKAILYNIRFNFFSSGIKASQQNP